MPADQGQISYIEEHLRTAASDQTWKKKLGKTLILFTNNKRSFVTKEVLYKSIFDFLN